MKPGDITLVGLIAEGGQGLATANNARFLGYLEETPQAEAIKVKRQQWTAAWLSDPRIKPVFLKLLRENGGDPHHPVKDAAAWEACVEPLKSQFDLRRDLGLSKADLYRIVPKRLLATREDYEFAWECRKIDLLRQWQRESQLREFWEQNDLLTGRKASRKLIRDATSISSEEFFNLFQDLISWWHRENERRKGARPKVPLLSRETLGLRANETYSELADGPRIATIYRGLRGRGQWVPFRKGDPEGNKWTTDEPLFIYWSESNVNWLFENSGKKAPNMPVVRNPHLYFLDNITWSRTANHTEIKARVQPPCVFDSDSTVLTPVIENIPASAFLALLNSDLLSFFCKKLLNNTNKYEITDLRMLPLVIPTSAQVARLAELARRAIICKQLCLSRGSPSNDVVAYVRGLSDDLTAKAPGYLKPPAQLRLLNAAADCLAIIELTVNWEAEKLYGVEGHGPFNEF